MINVSFQMSVRIKKDIRRKTMILADENKRKSDLTFEMDDASIDNIMEFYKTTKRLREKVNARKCQ